MSECSLVYKKLAPFQIAYLMKQINSRQEILPLFDKLREICTDAICGDAMVIFHGGAVKDGFLVEVAFPVNHPVETSEVHSRILETAPAISASHYGSHTTMRETILKIYDHFEKHAWTTSLFRREIYKRINQKDPEQNETEIQVIVHEWDSLLAAGAQKVLGEDFSQTLMQGIETITPASSSVEYVNWIQGAIDRLDKLTDDESKKCKVVANCAHVFPQERIDHLREIYENGKIDDILSEMYLDDFWYEKPFRRANVIYMRKNPFDPEGYARADSPAARRRAYCHCSFVHPYLDELPSKLSPTFCYCGVGWYQRLWEGILKQPVKIESVESLLRGNDQCTFTITLPFEVTGQFIPERQEGSHD